MTTTARLFAITGKERGELLPFLATTEPGWGECVMRVSHSIISPGTEMLLFRSHQGQTPWYPGYTAVGTITARGEGFRGPPNDLPVFFFPAADDQLQCHASHKLVKRDALFVPLPEGLDPAKACFARLVNVALTPFAHIDSKINGSVLVVGLGLVGNLAGQVARVKGFEVIGIDPDAARRGRARKVGIHHVIDPAEGDPVKQVRELTGSRGASLTINATGAAATFMTAIEATADGGELSTLGGARGEAGVDVQAFLHHVQARQVTVRGGWEMLLPRRPVAGGHTVSVEENLRVALRWIRDDSIRLGPIWTHTLKPEGLFDSYKALNKLHRDYLGVVVDWK